MYEICYIAAICMKLSFISFTGPSALTVNITKNTENSSVVVQWDELDDSLITTYYVIYWTGNRTNTMQFNTLIERSSYTLTGLTLDTVYTITVTAANRCGAGQDYRTSVSLTTDATINSITPTPTITASETIIIVSTAPPTTLSTTVSPTPTVNFSKSTSHFRNVVFIDGS